MSEIVLSLDREIEDVKAQVRRELETIRDLLDAFGYRDSSPGWNIPFQLHKLRRAMRVHYMAMRLREASLPSCDNVDLSWEL